VQFVSGNERPSSPPAVGGRLKVASFNVLNYFLTLDIGTQANCGPLGSKQECRGAETAEELTRQQQKLNAALLKLDADVLGLIELENTQDAQGNDVNPLADIVTRLNTSLGGDVYGYVNTGIIGTDTIRVGLVYKKAKVTPVGNPLADTAAIHNRPPVAQLFSENSTGEKFSVVVNHFKSKGCDGASGLNLDQNDGQGCWNATRVQQSQALLAFINGTVIPAAGDNDVLLVGDFNAYAKEAPITTLEAAGFTNLISKFGGANAYSYVFDGQWGYLDHGLASASLVPQVTNAADYHINSDEPSVLDYNTNFKSAGQVASLFAADEFRTSDHDPVVIGLSLKNNIPALTAITTYDTGLGANGAEIVSIKGNRAVLTNAGDGSLDIIDISDPLNPKLLKRVTGLTGLNSVAIHPTEGYFLAVTGVSSPAANPVYGKILAFRLSDGTKLAEGTVGILPDSVGISPDGKYAVVANEAEAFAQGDNGGPGSLSLVDLNSFDPDTSTTLSVTQIALPSQNGTPGFSTGRTDDIGRLPVDNTPDTLEPETVAFSADSVYAYVTLQENNGVVRLKLSDSSLTFFGLGQTTHLADLSTSGGYNPTSTLTAFREPDGIVVVEIGGTRYFVTADEGDTRDGAGSNSPRGGRTVSIFNADTGAVVADTGSQLDDLAAARGLYPDSRSNRGGSEPEMLDAVTFNGRTIVAVGLERANAVAFIDITNPATPLVFQLIPTGLAPEGVKLFVKSGQLYVFTANEASGTMTVAVVPVAPLALTQTYLVNSPLALHNVTVIDPDAGQTISVNIQLNPNAGALSTGTSGSTTSSFNAATGLYSVSGPVAEVNALLAGLVYTPAANSEDTVTATITVTDGNSASVTGTLTLEAFRRPVSLKLSNVPQEVVAGEAFDVTVTAYDVNGNVATAYRVNVQFSSTDSNATLPQGGTIEVSDNGVKTFSGLVLKTAGLQKLTVKGALENNTQLQSNEVEILVKPAAPASVELNVSTTAKVDEPAAVTVTIKDANGNIVTGYTGTVSFSSSDTKALLPDSYTFTAGDKGTKTFSVTFKTAGTQSLTVTDGSLSDTQDGIVVAKGAATVTLDNLTQTYDGKAKFATATTQPSGLKINITYSQNGNPVASPTNAGSYDVTATVDDPNYDGSRTDKLVIEKAKTTTLLLSSVNPSKVGQAVTFTAQVTTGPDVTTAPTGSVTFSVDGAVTTVNLDANGFASFTPSSLAIGNRLIKATYNGAANFNTSSDQLTQVVSNNVPNTRVTVQPVKAVYGGKVELKATYFKDGKPTAGQVISFTISGLPVCGVTPACPTTDSKGVATLKGVTLPSFLYPGTYNYGIGAAVVGTDVSGSGKLTIEKATAKVTLANLIQTYDGTARFATATTDPTGLLVVITYTQGGRVFNSPTSAGNYRVTATIDDPRYEGRATGILTIKKATATITLSDLTQVYDGKAKDATATTVPAGLKVILSYSQKGKSVNPVEPGKYEVTARVVDSNYEGTKTAVLEILPGTPVVKTGSARYIDDTTATLNGVIDPNYARITEIYFEWGVSKDNLSNRLVVKDKVSGNGNQSVSADLKGLTPSTTYYFRLVVKYGNGSAVTGDVSNFKTTRK
jgi:hypothetical protein